LRESFSRELDVRSIVVTIHVLAAPNNYIVLCFRFFSKNSFIIQKAIICATEASATGELLFRDLLGELKIETRQYMRLWLKGRSDTAIREGYV
jgi:hypothetical protein